jgi:hypothetical protein
MSIERRLKKLEEAAGAGEPCPECGSAPGQPVVYDPVAHIEVRAIFEVIGEEDGFCGMCGSWQPVITIGGPQSRRKERA